MLQQCRSLQFPFSGRPPGLDFDCAINPEKVMTGAAPLPVFRVLAQSTFHRVAMDVAQLFDALVLAPYVEVVVAGLPETACRALGNDLMGCDLFEHLKRCR